MQVITAYNPHATLMSIGAKTVWDSPMDTRHRGWTAIHAAKTSPEEYTGLATIDPFVRVLNAIPGYSGVESLPAGKIIGVFWLAAVTDAYLATTRWNVRKEAWLPGTSADYDDVPLYEIAFGDYTKGRKAWWATMIYALPDPIPARGMPGMWDTKITQPDLPRSQVDALEHAVKRQMWDAYRVDISKHAMDDPAMWRLVNRRGTLGHSPKERVPQMAQEGMA